MQFRQFAFVFQTLVMTILMSLTPNPVFAASGVMDICELDKPSKSLPHDAIKVLSLNIAHGRNTAPNQIFVSKKRTYRNLDKVALLLEEIAPDIVALQEADAPSRWSGRFDHSIYVAEKAGFPCVIHGRHSQSWMSSFGTALLSRSRATEHRSVRFSPSWPSKQKGYVSATFDWSVGQRRVPVTMISVHFDFLSRSERERQVKELIEGMSGIDGPLVLMGDLNSQWDDDRSQVRMLAEELNLRAFYPERSGLGTYKKLTGKRLDWILITQELEFMNYKVLPAVVADHFAVTAEIAYRGQHD